MSTFGRLIQGIVSYGSHAVHSEFVSYIRSGIIAGNMTSGSIITDPVAFLLPTKSMARMSFLSATWR